MRTSAGAGAGGGSAPDLDELYRRENRRIFATLVRLLGSFDLAEDALHDAFLAAAERWPAHGAPANPVAWLVSAGRFRAIDRLRRDARLVDWERAGELAEAVPDSAPLPGERELLEDDRLRLVFTCCHPSLSDEACVALTLREVCGLTTEQIARAFLAATPALAQRIVRAKAKIRDARIPYAVPEASELPGRLSNVLRVVYLVFNEGYSASSGGAAVVPALIDEAVRLGRLLLQLLPLPEVQGLLALMLLHDARRAARTDAAGELVALEDQDRSRWDQARIREGAALALAALRQRGFGPYALQAAIAALHGEAASAEATDWAQIAGLYDALLRLEPTPVVALNRAVAVAMRDGPGAGLVLIEPLLAGGGLDGYWLAHAARADLCRRAGRDGEARAAYREALRELPPGPQRRFLERRLATLAE